MLPNTLKIVKEQAYDSIGFELTELTLNEESAEYGACSFKLNEIIIEHRASKITPKKTGQFVAIWKRNKDGITAPFDVSDTWDVLMITSGNGKHLGQFIFPKSMLAEKGVVSKNGKGGKRGIRVYPPWDRADNKQAQKTQSWQIKYFVTLPSDENKPDALKTLLEQNLQVKL